jgi:uncharacterized protein (TIGR00296 family)
MSHSLPVRLAFAALDDLLAGYRNPGASTPATGALLAEAEAASDPLLADLHTRQAGVFVSFHLHAEKQGDLKGAGTGADADAGAGAGADAGTGAGADAGAEVDEDDEGALRGCIGTIAACCPNVIEELCCNTVSAAKRDPRFPPISAAERDRLSCSVDILGNAEPITDMAALDVRRYGVIVSKGHRRGLLLPDLAGVDSPAEQVSIAARKGGISLDEDYMLERFEVVRYR